MINNDDYIRLYMGVTLEQYENYKNTRPEFKMLISLIEQLIIRNKQLEEHSMNRFTIEG